MVGGLADGLDRIPSHLLRSVTFDQGSEWADWAVIAGHYRIDTWFCGPHSPWQRGQVENQNRTWRWWSPAAPTSPDSTPPTSTTSPASSTTSDDATLATKAPPAATLPPAPCTDR